MQARAAPQPEPSAPGGCNRPRRHGSALIGDWRHESMRPGLQLHACRISEVCLLNLGATPEAPHGSVRATRENEEKMSENIGVPFFIKLPILF
jgi:hypothetical protein